MGIFLTAKKPGARLSVGSSKLFGNPHVWEGFQWPSLTADGQEFDLAFICQINCADLTGLDRAGLLPSYGVLYFFYDLDGMPEKGGGRVIYYNGYLEDLHEMALIDETGAELGFPEQSISFGEGAVCPPHKMLCEKNGKTVLLSLASFETSDIKLNFPSGAALNFYIDAYNLSKKDFSCANSEID